MTRWALVLPVAAFAALAGLTSPANAAPPNCAVDKAASHIRAIAPHDGTNYVAAFQRWTADIAFDAGDLANSMAKIEIDTGSVRTGDARLDESLPTAGWLASSRFPTATYLSSRFRSQGRDRYSAHGHLTLKGVTKAVPLSFTIRKSGLSSIVEGTAWVHRKLFKIGEGDYAGADYLPYEILVRFRLVAMC